MVVLNSKLYVSGNYDIWWYNLSNPSKILFGDEIILNLWDEKNANLIKQINIQVDKNWLKRIRLGSTHIYKKREICKETTIPKISHYILERKLMAFIKYSVSLNFLITKSQIVFGLPCPPLSTSTSSNGISTSVCLGITTGSPRIYNFNYFHLI